MKDKLTSCIHLKRTIIEHLKKHEKKNDDEKEFTFKSLLFFSCHPLCWLTSLVNLFTRDYYEDINLHKRKKKNERKRKFRFNQFRFFVVE